MGHPHITIAMLGPSFDEVLPNKWTGRRGSVEYLPVHQTSYHEIFSDGDTWKTKSTLQNLQQSLFLHFWNNKILIKN